MPFALQLQDARSDLINLAGIDGKTGVNARHTTGNLNRLLNRKYRALRSRVSWAGLPHFLATTGQLSLPAAVSGEDFIEIPIPAASEEVVGVDVTTLGGRWGSLDPLGWEQRRDVTDAAYFFTPFALRGQTLPQAPRGVGWWAVNKAPAAVQATTISGGTVAIWPTQMTGRYQLFSAQGWTDITTDTHVFVLYEAWDEWLLNAAAMAVCQRDRQKQDNYNAAKDAWQVADGLISQSAARLQRGGYSETTPYGGFNL
jgi:hypothetical protein